MPGKNKDPNLSQEELNFIQKILRDTKSDLVLMPNKAEMDAPAQDPRILELLQMANELRLQADVGDYTLLFYPRVELIQDTNTRQFHLGYPTIVEKTGHSRSRRINLEPEEINIIETKGQLENPTIENISATGIALVTEHSNIELVPGKTLLTLKVRFSNEKWHDCDCSVVWAHKHNKKIKLALRFHKLSQDMYDQLRSYVYHHSPEIQEAYDGEFRTL